MVFSPDHSFSDFCDSLSPLLSLHPRSRLGGVGLCSFEEASSSPICLSVIPRLQIHGPNFIFNISTWISNRHIKFNLEKNNFWLPLLFLPIPPSNSSLGKWNHSGQKQGVISVSSLPHTIQYLSDKEAALTPSLVIFMNLYQLFCFKPSINSYSLSSSLAGDSDLQSIVYQQPK